MQSALLSLSTFTLCLACPDDCSFCAAAAATYIQYAVYRDSCNLQFCARGQECPISCSMCVFRGYQVSCESDLKADITCPSSTETCGVRTVFTSASGAVSVEEGAPPLTLCHWVLDLRTVADTSLQDPISVSVEVSESQENCAEATIASYSVLSSESLPDLSQHKPGIYTLRSSAYVQQLKQSIHANYMYSIPSEVAYWLRPCEQRAPRATLRWSMDKDSDGTNLAATLALVAAIAGSLLCYVCCIVCAIGAIKATRRSRVYFDAAGLSMIFGERPRPTMLNPPPNLVEADIDVYLPVVAFSPELIEVGEAVCTICFEKYSPHSLAQDIKVRRMPCKHIFHDACLVTWIVSMSHTLCPMCKCNPFDQQPPTVLDASRIGEEESTSRIRLRQ